MSSGAGRLAAVYREVRESGLKHSLPLPFSFILRGSFKIVDGPASSATGNPDKIAKFFPKLFGQASAVRVPTGSAPLELNQTNKICGVLSGGQASGGHNVISDYLRGSRMHELKGGAARIMKCKYVERSTDFMYPYRNQAFSHHTSRPISAPSLYMLQSDRRSSNFLLWNPSISFHSKFGQSIRMKHSLTRSWLVTLWAAEKEGKIQRRKRRPRIARPVHGANTLSETLSSFRLLPLGSVLNRPVVAEQQRRTNRTINRPPQMQFDEGFPSPNSLEEVKLAPLLARPNLLITRDIEWANIMFAFEQESRYIVVDPNYPHSPVGYIREQSNVIYRQLLRTRRPFIASITDSMGNEIFRIRRPFWFINSTIYAEVGDKVVGVVHRRWHLWRRIYDLYLGNKQFAVVENPGFWNWTFTLKDDDDNVLAQIDRDWRGLGLELFTDAGQYVIRFGHPDSRPPFGQTSAIPDLEVARPLSLTERAVAVALAVSLDTDYFSRRGGWGLPILIAGE